MSDAAQRTGGERIAAVGDPTSVAGFRPLGFAVFALDDPTAARGLWPRLSGGEFGVVFVTDAVYEALGDLLQDVRDAAFPAVTVIPGAGGAGSAGEARLARAIERALGTTVPFGSEEG